MNNDRKIDYEYLIHSHSCAGRKKCDMNLPCNECIKRDFEAVGLGNVKQAVKEFAEKLKSGTHRFGVVDGNNYYVWYDSDIDNLITELYGADE